MIKKSRLALKGAVDFADSVSHRVSSASGQSFRN